MRITMIGHSTLLIEGEGTRLLTDPYFGTFGHIAYARVRPPAVERDDARDIDAALVSHSHWDHTDRGFFRRLTESVPVFGPRGSSLLMQLKGVRTFVAMRPWETREAGNAMITAVPALHVARTVGFVITIGGVSAYFAGDTWHRPFMAEIGRRFDLDVAMIPVTTYRVPLTMGERAAVKAVRDLHPATVIPIHLGIQPRAFFLRTRQTPAGFERRLRESGSSVEVAHLREGDAWESPALAAAATG